VAETTEELVLDIGQQLVDLVAKELPLTLSRQAPMPRRALLALAVKTTAIMRASLDLIEKNRLAEVLILGRSLADCVITLAWLTAATEENYPRWEKDDAKQRLDAHERWQDSGRGPLLQPDAVAHYEQILSAVENFPPNLFQRAEQADVYWPARLGFPDGDTPFTDTYNIIFRHSSSRTHASIQGLNDVLETTPDHNVISLDRIDDPLAGPLRAILTIFGLGLVVSAAATGFPRRDCVERIYSGFLRRRAEMDAGKQVG
jgi:hypothetical protein